MLLMLVLLPAVSFCVLASSAGSKRRSQTGEWSVDVVALAAPIRFIDHILGSQERHLAVAVRLCGTMRCLQAL
jgi:hypothetical protein